MKEEGLSLFLGTILPTINKHIDGHTVMNEERLFDKP